MYDELATILAGHLSRALFSRYFCVRGVPSTRSLRVCAKPMRGVASLAVHTRFSALAGDRENAASRMYRSTVPSFRGYYARLVRVTTDDNIELGI
jgi:hypothetical protein